MTQNLSRRYEKNGFVALLSDGNKNVLNVFPVKANQIYNIVGMQVVFAETKEALKTACVAAGFVVDDSKFA